MSNLGRIVMLHRVVKAGHGLKSIHPRLLDIKHKKNGYYFVDLWSNNKRRHSYVHRIIAQAWIDNPNNFTQIDHINGDRLDNSIENIRWCTYAINNSNPISKRRRILARRKDDFKFAEVACIKDGVLIKTYPYVALVAADGFRKEGVYNCLNGHQRSHRGCQWMYLSEWGNLNINKSKNS